MDRLLLILVILTLVLASGAPESPHVRAQDEIIVATGGLDETLVAEFGDTLMSSRIDLSFPAGGGDVTGDWSLEYRVDLGLDNEGNVFCVFDLAFTGRLQGRYDGGRMLNGTTTFNNSPSVVSGCEDVGLSPASGSFDWSGTLVGGEVSVDFESEALGVKFAAHVSPAGGGNTGDTSDAGEDAEAPADDATDPFLDILRIYAGERTGGEIFDRMRELLRKRCAESVTGDADCSSEARTDDRAHEFAQEFQRRIPDRTLNETVMAGHLYNALYMADATGPGGQPLFPSIIAAMPVVKKLAADLSTAEPEKEEETVRMVRRFMELLMARDARLWETRFP
jgi:hypothetical protein